MLFDDKIVHKIPQSVKCSLSGRCADNEPADPAAGEVTLTFWTPTWRQAAEEPIIADFMEKYPNIKIETTFMSSDDIKANNVSSSFRF